MTEKIMVGSIIHARLPGGWYELRIVGETSQSWLTEDAVSPQSREKYKVLKRDLSFAAFPGSYAERYRGVRYQAYTDEGKSAYRERDRQIREFFKLIPAITECLGRLSFNTGAEKIWKIAEILGIETAAQAGEAGTAETALAGSVHEHATPSGDAP